MSKASVNCPNCSASLTVPMDVLGRKIKCPKCQEVVRLPKPEDNKHSVATEKEPPQATTIPRAAAPTPAAPTPAAPTTAAPTPAAPTTAAPTTAAPTTAAPTMAAPTKAAPIMAKPIVPMPKVISPDALPIITKTASKSEQPSGKAPVNAPASAATPSPNTAPAATSAPMAAATPKEAPPNFSDLEAKVGAAEKPRVKLRRKKANPWPILLLGGGALLVLGLVVTLLIIFLPQNLGGSGSTVPEIQFVNDSTTEVGKTVRIPISVVYPSTFSAAEKQRWSLQAAPENPAGAAWEADSGSLTWSPGTRDAGRSHTMAMTIQDTVTREINRGTFQVHVPPLSPGIMSALAQLNRNGSTYTASLPKTNEAMKHQETIPTGVEFQFGSELVFVYDYSSVEIATAKLGEIDESAYEALGLNITLTPPLRLEQRDGAIMVASTAAVESTPAIKTWFDPPQE